MDFIRSRKLKIIYAILVVLIAFFLVIPLQAIAQVYLFQWGEYGDANGQFNDPIGVAIDSSDNIYVVDSGNNRVQKFNSQGTFIIAWGATGSDEGQFNSPQGIAIDSDDAVYVADWFNDRIQKFDSNGNFIATWGMFGEGYGQFDGPHGVAVDSTNSIYITDSGNNRIQKFDSDGNYLLEWGSTGNNDGQFVFPKAIAIKSSDRIYVSDSYDRIQVFNSDGLYIDSFGQTGTFSSAFLDVMGIAVDYENNLYITDFGNIRVQKLDETGYPLTKWGIFGKSEGEFDWPFGIAVNVLGHIYVVDSRNNRIQVFGPPLPPTYSLSNYRMFYSLTNNRTVEENGFACEPKEDLSGNTHISEKKWGEVSGYFDGDFYRGFVSAATYDMTHTEKDNNSIITERILITLTSQIAGYGKYYFSKTNNDGLYCKSEGDIEVTLAENEPIHYHIPDFSIGGVG